MMFYSRGKNLKQEWQNIRIHLNEYTCVRCHSLKITEIFHNILKITTFQQDEISVSVGILVYLVESYKH